MGGAEHVSYAFGGLLIAVGAGAYACKRSIHSLVAGCLLGSTLIGSGALIHTGRHLEGHSLALGTSLATIVAMSLRVIKAQSWSSRIISGLIVVCAGLSVHYQRAKVMEWFPGTTE
jgi:uncharacterized membrane protein (UPF0136 family)